MAYVPYPSTIRTLLSPSIDVGVYPSYKIIYKTNYERLPPWRQIRFLYIWEGDECDILIDGNLIPMIIPEIPLDTMLQVSKTFKISEDEEFRILCDVIKGKIKKGKFYYNVVDITNYQPKHSIEFQYVTKPPLFTSFADPVFNDLIF